MGILSYIEAKKAKFKDKMEANRTANFAKKEKVLKELELKNKVRENDLKIERDLERAKAKDEQLSKELKSHTIGGRLAKKIKDKYNESRKENKARLGTNSGSSLFTGGSLGSNPFTGNTSGGSNPFTSGSLGRNVFSNSGSNAFTPREPKQQKRTVTKITYK